MCASFWVIPPHLNFIRRRFGTLCSFHLHMQAGMKYILRTYLPMKGEHSVPKRRNMKFRHLGITRTSLQHSEHGES